jgi:hypothetical protein
MLPNSLITANNKRTVTSTKMGSTQTKQVDNTGEVNNIITIPATNKIETMLGIMIGMMAFSIAYQLYRDYHRGLKKKYRSQQST